MERRRGGDAASTLARYGAAIERLDATIEPAPADASPPAIRARAEARMARTRRLLARLGDPHRAYPVVHVGGTSGKGSTAVAIASILGATGRNIGLHVSPYLQAATEKIQIGGRLIAGDSFADLTDEVLAAAAQGPDAMPTYGELSFAVTALAFARAGVDLAVIEVGAGGRFDLTNVVDPVVSVVTSVGLDHMETLGSTIAEIAWHKAGIIKPGRPVVTAVADGDGFDMIASEARRTGSAVHRVAAGRSFAVRAQDRESTEWQETGANGAAGSVFRTAMPGRFQALNAATAVHVVRTLGGHGFGASDGEIAAGLLDARLPGRTELVGARPWVMLDGAHNPQKIAALAADIRGLAADRPLVAVVGVLQAKDHAAILGSLISRIDALITTEPAITAKEAAAADEIAASARNLGFRGEIFSEPTPTEAVTRSIALAGGAGAVIVTGSLYLIGNVRGRWFPDEEIVLQRTSWPTGEAG